jgi:FMN-dependent NADH-azoreductase
MSRFLYIQASPRGKRSHCIAVADAFVETYKQKYPADEIVTLNVFDASIPDFDGPAVQAKYTILHGKPHSNEEKQVWKNVEEVIDQFTVQPGYTFSYSDDAGYQGLVVGKPMLVVYARGAEYPQGSDAEAFDMQSKYIESIFGFMGFENIRSVVVEPTLQGGPDVAAEKRRKAVNKAKEMAAVF